jgi:iron-sulfur cluster assembly protein
MSINITDAAAKAIIEKTALKEGAIGLRLKVTTIGCSGNSYVMEHVMEEDLDADERFDEGEARLYIPKINSWMLIGTEIDYEEGDMGAGFTFTNPNEAGRCGCGESFSVDR